MQKMILIPESEYIGLKNEIAELKAMYAELLARHMKLQEELAEALRRLNQNSSNSNLPPSADLFKKKKIVSMREKSGKSSGGQPGHKGSNFAQSATPDIIETHSPKACSDCQCDLDSVAIEAYTKRQEINVKAYKYVKEHRCESKICPCCGLKNVGQFPKNITGPVQYGATIQADVVYGVLHQMSSFKRFRQEMKSRHGLTISDGTICNIIETLAKNLAGFEEELKAYLVKTFLAHFDESGININGKNHWMFVMSNEFVSLFKAHKNRSEKALQDINVFFNFRGLSVHDCFPMYFINNNCKHAICYAHVLRELKAILLEEERELWAKDLTDFLLDAHKKRATFSEEMVIQHINKFHEIVQNGLSYHDKLPPLARTNKRGKVQQRKGKNLLDRLVKYDSAAVRFLQDPNVPFTNNQAEQDLRMIKVKMKVSIFRTKTGADMYALIRSYIETAKKLGIDIFQALIDALQGHPFSLQEKLMLSP